MSGRPRRRGLTLALGWLAVATAAHADGGWVLWTRSCSVKSETCGGDWRRRQTYEAERWCRAARATLVNQALTPEARETAMRSGSVVEYQCFPDSTDPRKPKAP
jgi:hypothetical protein